ncbi:MAG: hypothetical protein QOE91_990, partial [Gaiellaceae bacterium]|nr:hypothetical protein [Gaiellaceae bacterium]
MTERVPDIERLDDVRALRELLDAAPFDVETVQRLLRVVGELNVKPMELPLQLRRLRGDESAAAALVKLFMLGVTMERDRVDASLAPLGFAGLERLRLARNHEGGVRGTIRLIPHDDLYVASDRPDEEAGADHVAGIHRPSTTLSHLTVRRPVARALDVGTGNGIQALRAARHAERVVATDINARALVF